jgi:hypothetical protein
MVLLLSIGENAVEEKILFLAFLVEVFPNHAPWF